ncbi:MAG: DUF4115 domain-containing protein [bacterium]|nr:DUF4115 domain-containing protein [bacterium]
MAHNEFPGDVDSPDAGIRVSRRIADELRRTRVARSLSIEDVAAILRIRPGFIEAMEEDRFDDLPGPAYISGFLRTYANHLDLDGDQLVAWFKDDSQSTFAPREMELPVPITEIRRPTFPIITVSLVIAIGIAAGWYVYQESRSIDIDLIPEVPGPVAEGISTDLPDDERSGTLDGDDLFATDTVRATMEPEDDATHVAEASVPLDTSGTTGDDVASDSAGLAGDGGADEAVAQTVVLPDTAGTSADAGDDGVADVVSDSAGLAGDGDPDEAVAETVVLPDTAGTSADAGDDGVADVVSDSAGLAGDGDPDEAVAETVVLPDTAGISGDGSPDVVNDDAVSGAETNTPQDDAGVSLQDVADATGAETGGEESWDEPVFASGDTVQESAVADVGESDSQHTIYGTPGAGSRIELRAVGETWVQVRAPDGIAVLTHILLPGDVYHVPERDDLMLDTGNAGGLEIRVDGELMPPLGGSGAVVRDILLSVESLTRR